MPDGPATPAPAPIVLDPGGPQAAPAARSALHDGVRPGQNL